MAFQYFIQSLVSGLLIGSVYSLVAIGLNLIIGVMGIVTFAHGSLLALGMYVSYYSFTLFGVDPYIAMLFSGPILFVVGLGIQRFFITPVIDAPQSSILLITLGISILLDNLMALSFGHEYRMIRLSYGDKTIFVGNLILSIPRLVAFCFSLLSTVMLFFFLKSTKTGKAIRAVASEKEGAMLVGINVARIYLITFGLGSAIAGIGGSLILPFLSVSPYVGMGFLIYAFIAMVLGGMGNLMGSLLGGLIIGGCEGIASLLIGPSLRQLVSYFILVGILLFKPSGLLGEKLEAR